MYVPGHYLVNTSALSEAEAILGEPYGPMTIVRATTVAEPWIRIWRTSVGPMTLDDAEVTSAIRCEVEAPTGILLCRVRAGRVEFHADEHEHHCFERGDVVAIVNDGLPMTGVLSHARCDVVSFAPSFLAEAATGFGDCTPEMKRFALPVNPSAGQLVSDVIDHIRHFIANNPQVAGEPLVVTSAARYLMAVVLTAFPRSAFGI